MLLGVDGTLHGGRQRAKFFSANADVPMMVISIAASAVLATACRELMAMLDDPVMTLERSKS